MARDPQPFSPAALVDDSAGQFPAHMVTVRDVFAFSNDEITRASRRFQNASDLLEALAQVRNAISASDLPEPDKDHLLEILEDERELIAFAGISRNSVISV